MLARDNSLVALLTMGEGYHNFHHRFPNDYRNGVRLADDDPTKRLVHGLAVIGAGFLRSPANAVRNNRPGTKPAPFLT